MLGRILRFPLRFIPSNLTVYILQGKLKGKKWIVGSSNHGCWWGTYEQEKQFVFFNLVAKGAVVYDIGANVGFYTLLASMLVGHKGRVFAFEPLSRNICYLRKHLQINHCSNVVILEAAVSQQDGAALFKEGENSSTGHLSAEEGFKIETVSLDSLVLTGKIPPPNYIKIDVEGAELSVLFGAKRILIDYHPVVFLSNPGAAHLHDQCCAFLNSLGYDLRSIDGKQDINSAAEILALQKR